MTEKEKLKMVKEALDIIMGNCVVLGIDFPHLEPKYTQLAIRMFVEGCTYWEQKRKEGERN